MRWLTLLLLAGAVFAQERASTTQQADRLIAAREDPAAFAKLAAMTQPDRWSVADELSSRGEHDVAVAFARASDLKDKENLLAYLASRREKPTPKGTWAVLWPLWNRAFAGKKDVPEAAAPYVKQGGFVGSFATTIHAVSLVQAGRAAEAAPLLERALKTMEELGCRNNTAWNLYWLGLAQPDKAEHYFRRVLALEEDVFRFGAAHDLGWILGNRGRFAEAKKWLTEAVRVAKGPDSRVSAMGLLATAEFNLGNKERALGLWEKAAAERPGVDTWINLAWALTRLERWDEAAALYEKCVASKHARWAEAKARLAACHNKRGRFADALACARDALATAQRDEVKADAHYQIGWALQQLGRLAEAERAYRAALPFAKADRTFQLNVRATLAQVLADQKRYVEALRATDAILARRPLSQTLALRARLLVLLERANEAPAVAARAVALAQNNGERAIALSAQGVALVANGDRPGALAALRAAAEASRNDPHLAASVATDFANVARKTGDVGLQIEHLERALAYYEKVGAKRELAGWYGNLSSAHSKRGNTKKAVDAAERGLKHAETLGDPTWLARALRNLAAVTPSPRQKREVALRAHTLADEVEAATRTEIWTLCGYYLPPAEAVPWLRRAIDALTDKAEIANALQKLAQHHQHLLQPDAEQAALERSIRLAKELNDERLLFWGETRLAMALAARGRMEEARALLERTLQALGRIPDPLWRRGASIALANTMMDLGEHERALALLDEVRALDEKGVGAPFNVATAWHTRGMALENLERYDEALAAYRRSIEIAKAHGFSHGPSLGNIAWIHYRRAEYAHALTCMEEVLALARANGSDYRVLIALNNISGVHEATGDLAAARAAIEATLEPSRRYGGRRHAGALLNLARVELNEGDVEAARKRLLAALALHEDRKILAVLARTEAAGSDEQRVWLEKAVALGWSRAGLALWYASRERWEKAAEQLRLARAKPPASPLSRAELHSIAGFVEAQRGNLDAGLAEVQESIRLLNRATAGLDDERAGGVRASHAYVFGNALQVAGMLKRPAAAFAIMESARAAALLQSLGNREALLAVAVPPKLRAAEREARRREAAALERYRRAVKAGSGGSRRLWRELRAAGDDVLQVVERIQRAQRLQADLVFPKAVSLAEVQRALQEDEALLVLYTQEQAVFVLVFQGRSFRYRGLVKGGKDILAAAKALRRAAATAPTRGLDVSPHETAEFLARRLRELLIEPLKLGDGVRRVLISPSGDLAYVPFAALLDREVAYIPSATTYTLLREQARKRGKKILALGDPTAGARLLASGEEAKAVGDEVLRRDDASVAKLREKLPGRRWRAVHFACHGRVHPTRPLLSSLQLSGGDLRCMDVFRMKIPADLAVLSACETGKGKVYSAEGVVGFTRAFLFAGTPRVIVSLWKVDDEATKALMVKFYELWKTQPAATALKNAQAHVASQDKWKHPYYWAAWQLWGLPE